MSVHWCLCGYRTDRLWQVPEQVHLLFRHSFLIDVKLDRTSAPLSERSVVMVISPLVSLSEAAIFKVLVCLFDVQCHSLWKEVLLLHLPKIGHRVSTWYLIRELCGLNVFTIRGTCCLSVYPDLLLECVLMNSAFNGKSIV